MNRKNNEGSSLIEILIAIVLLAIIVIPACSSLVLSHRINAKTEEMLQAQLAVSSAVETLMAKGIPQNYLDLEGETPTTEEGYWWKALNDQFPEVKIEIKREDPDIPYYNIIVSSDVGIEIKTTVRAVEAVPVETTQDPGQEGGSQ